ncbi:MAG: ABC transporter permease [Synergistaceae bacterium]|jgi:ABC-2 type transport system permease protein|nr:ABC transporter permease [Synergistaceae bacterium]
MSGVLLSMRRVMSLFIKELLATLKDPANRVILIAPVILQSALFGYAATLNLDDVPYAVLDQSAGRTSANIRARLDGSGVFRLTEVLGGTSGIADSIDSGSALLVVHFGPDFEDAVSSGRDAPIQVITDGRNSMTAGIALGYLGRVLSGMAEDRNSVGRRIKLEVRAWYNPDLITRWNFMPSMIATLSMIQVLILAGLSVAREREQGTFDQLLVTPLSPLEILVGKALPPMLIGMAQSSIVLAVCALWFRIPMSGSLSTLCAVLGIFMLSCVGMGLSISAVSESMQQVMVYSFVLIMPMVLLSGITTPLRNMPEALQILTYANPLRFGVECVRRVYLEGAGISDVAANFIPMAAVVAITMPLAAWLFRNRGA